MRNQDFGFWFPRKLLNFPIIAATPVLNSTILFISLFIKNWHWLSGVMLLTFIFSLIIVLSWIKFGSLTEFSHQTPGREFLLRVSYLEIYNEVSGFLLLSFAIYHMPSAIDYLYSLIVNLSVLFNLCGN